MTEFGWSEFERGGSSDAQITKARARSIEFAVKRTLDVLCAGFLLILAAPLFVAISVWIYLAGGSRILFAHERIGRGGQSFKCLKFRTMVPDAASRLEKILQEDPVAKVEWETTRKLRRDPRIVPGIGNFLRESSLDELPQLWNVVRGDMSMVGPRPVTYEELNLYGDAKDQYLSLRPGMTGPWQVGERSDGDFVSRVKLDASYVEGWSVPQDIMIMLKTARIMLHGRSPGAY